jgi:hypothetical protein
MKKTALALLVIVLSCLGVGWTQQAESFNECSKQFPREMIRVSSGVLETQVVNKVLPEASDLKSAPDSDVQIVVRSYQMGKLCVKAVKGDPALFERSETAARKWKIRPYMLDGAPIIMESRFVFRYRKGKLSVRFED